MKRHADQSGVVRANLAIGMDYGCVVGPLDAHIYQCVLAKMFWNLNLLIM